MTLDAASAGRSEGGMTDADHGEADDGANRPPRRRPLTAAAHRALAEAAARRAEIDARVAGRPKELAGRDGPDPVRYGDWEVNGLASDF